MKLHSFDINSSVSAQNLKCSSLAWLGSEPFQLGSAQLGKFQLELITRLNSSLKYVDQILKFFKLRDAVMFSNPGGQSVMW